MKKSEFAIVIPARYQSSRFPGKPLAPILGVPMILRAARLCAKAVPKEMVFIATDHPEIENVVKKDGFHCIRTPSEARTGTDRVWSASKKIRAKYFVNVQGDEPILDPKDIIKVMRHQKKFPKDVINAYRDLLPNEDPKNINLPKLVMNERQQLLYMSRLPIPGVKSADKKPRHYKQVCIYSFPKNALDEYGKYGKRRRSLIEEFEDIEILRFFELNFKIQMVEAHGISAAVDEPSDLLKVESLLRNSS
jgi:3-deoxy-manno-octulosonate cytidylyltransferase (CMP-KDO synthetase)